MSRERNKLCKAPTLSPPESGMFWAHENIANLHGPLPLSEGRFPCLLGPLRLLAVSQAWWEWILWRPYTVIRIHPLCTVKADNSWGHRNKKVLGLSPGETLNQEQTGIKWMKNIRMEKPHGGQVKLLFIDQLLCNTPFARSSLYAFRG